MNKFFKEAVKEIKKIQWPTKKETLRLTEYVIGVSLGVGFFVMLIDYVFKSLLTSIL